MKPHLYPFVLLFFIGCSGNSSNVAPWGVGGTLAGAGTGAAVGSLISNGDVAASAGLGAAIGLGSGLLIGAALDASEAAQAEALADQVEENQAVLRENDQRIDELYRERHEDSQRQELDDYYHQRVYDGPTLGNYYR